MRMQGEHEGLLDALEKAPLCAPVEPVIAVLSESVHDDELAGRALVCLVTPLMTQTISARPLQRVGSCCVP